MTEEQTIATETHTESEQELGSEKSTEDAVAMDTTEQGATTKTSPEENPGQVGNSEPEQPITSKNQQKSPPEDPRFFIGVLFFLWVFCTLVLLSVTAGYIATR